MHTPTISALAIALALAAGLAQAQTSPMGSSSYDAGRRSWLPYTNNGYIGLNLGRSKYSTSCGSSAFGCDDSGNFGSVVLGGMFHPNFGAEIGYLNMGDSDRAGGTTRAQGLNLSLVGRAPLGSQFSVFGKLGTTYGRTRTSAAAGSGVQAGKDSGWGAAYGLGASWDFSPNWSATLEWQRHRFEFAGNRDDWVRATSLGVRYRF